MTIISPLIDSPARMEYSFSEFCKAILHEKPFDRGEVHAQKVIKPDMVTRELRNIDLGFKIPFQASSWREIVNPNLPWAEDHFQERVSGEPLNPPPSHEWWPYNQQGNAEHRDEDGQFSHSYPERFWPKYAPLVEGAFGSYVDDQGHPMNGGIRFRYGDLNDVVDLLKKNPRTRQAYLPIWFPEDGVASLTGERVPCTLGYHFLLTPTGELDMTYFMRSCDLVRFFRDDIYMAGRLLQWVAEKIHGVPGTLHFHTSNLHCFVGDTPYLEKFVKDQVDIRSTYNLGALG